MEQVKREKQTMADDDDDRQPPQSYDTVSPAGVGAASGNQMSPRAWQDLFWSGDQGLLDAAQEEMEAEPLYRFMQSIPPVGVDGVPSVQASSPAGVGSPGNQPFQSPQTSRLSSGARTPATPPSVPLAAGARTATGARTAAGAGGNGNGNGRGGGRSGRGGGAGRGRGGGGGGGGGGAGGGGGGGGGGAGGGGGGGGGGRRGRRPFRIRGRRRNTPTSPLTPASNPATPRGSWTSGSSGRQPRTLRQADLQRRLRMLLQDQEQLAQGREIANVTMTNSIVTSYKQGGAPSVQTSSSRVSP